PYSCGLRRTADAVVVNLRNSVHCWIVLRSVAFLTFGFAAHSWVQFSDVSSPPGRAAAVRDTSRIDLKQDWRIQSSAKLRQAGAENSKTGFDPNGWYPSSVPSTVLNALVQNKVYPDPYFGMNLRQLPGIAGDIGDNFTNLAMPPDSPFAVSWWYRTEFRLPPFEPRRHR